MSVQPLSVFCTLGLRGVLLELMPAMAARDLPLVARYGSTNSILQLITAGETADLGILIDSSVHDLAARGIILGGSEKILARSGVALAVRTGAPKPDISTVESFTRALRAACSIAYTVTGASGIHFAAVLEQLGIADEIRRKVTVQDGLVGELAARGEVELAIQQMSELISVPGIDIIGPLPGALQKMTVFAGGVFATSPRRDGAEALLAALSTAEAERVIRQKGLEPASAFV